MVVKLFHTSLKTLFLHGDLDSLIIQAKYLPNLDLLTDAIRKCLIMGNSCTPPFVKVLKTHSGKDKIITSYPYLYICLAGATIAQTRVILKCENLLGMNILLFLVLNLLELWKGGKVTLYQDCTDIQLLKKVEIILSVFTTRTMQQSVLNLN